MTDRKLPVLADASDDCGGGCDRRTLLQGIGIGALAAGCRIDDPTAVADAAAGDGPAPDGPAGMGFEACGSGMICVDLTHPANMNLLNVDGFRVIVNGNTRVIIIRTDANSFVTLTARCTHAGTSVGYRAAQGDIRCPNHGSLFNIDGSVKGGPATAPLNDFDNVFDEPGNLLTITIA